MAQEIEWPSRTYKVTGLNLAPTETVWKCP